MSWSEGLTIVTSFVKKSILLMQVRTFFACHRYPASVFRCWEKLDRGWLELHLFDETAAHLALDQLFEKNHDLRWLETLSSCLASFACSHSGVAATRLISSWQVDLDLDQLGDLVPRLLTHGHLTAHLVSFLASLTGPRLQSQLSHYSLAQLLRLLCSVLVHIFKKRRLH